MGGRRQGALMDHRWLTDFTLRSQALASSVYETAPLDLTLEGLGDGCSEVGVPVERWDFSP